MGVSLCGAFLEWRMTRQSQDPLQAFHETFVLLALLCLLSMAAAWRMPVSPGEIRSK